MEELENTVREVIWLAVWNSPNALVGQTRQATTWAKAAIRETKLYLDNGLASRPVPMALPGVSDLRDAAADRVAGAGVAPPRVGA